MGQQQLLLLVLGIVIVGLAVVVGIQAFSENKKKANADALVNDGIRIASDAQAWKLKPQAFGGGAGGTNWSDANGAALTLAQLGYTVNSGIYSNLNGTFTLDASGATLEIEGNSLAVSSGGGDLTIHRAGVVEHDPKTLRRL
ncbi:MAG: hypothetical protein R2834_04420 [Rhodothermales bacterium]